jgi:hypothetical protein
MQTILVMDTSSLINYTKYYYFDKYNEKSIYESLNGFLVSKIQTDEIRIIDKVYTEWYETRYNKEIRDEIKDKIVKTEFLIPIVQEFINNYKHRDNIRLSSWTAEQIDLELGDYESGKVADLYLIAYCKHIKDTGDKPVLITEETRREDKKIIQKIPTICQSEDIRYQNISYTLFEIYKHELKFELTII